MLYPALTSAQLRELEACVDAVVAGAPGRFFEPQSPDDDLYEETRAYGAFGEVHLRRPPGPVEDWISSLDAYSDGSGLWAVVTMWTKEEGRSDLALEISVDSNVVRPTAVIRGLHVL